MIRLIMLSSSLRLRWMWGHGFRPRVLRTPRHAYFFRACEKIHRCARRRR